MNNILRLVAVVLLISGCPDPNVVAPDAAMDGEGGMCPAGRIECEGGVAIFKPTALIVEPAATRALRARFVPPGCAPCLVRASWSIAVTGLATISTSIRSIAARAG